MPSCQASRKNGWLGKVGGASGKDSGVMGKDHGTKTSYSNVLRNMQEK